jgi:hypothetical protein
MIFQDSNHLQRGQEMGVLAAFANLLQGEVGGMLRLLYNLLYHMSRLSLRIIVISASQEELEHLRHSKVQSRGRAVSAERAMGLWHLHSLCALAI